MVIPCIAIFIVFYLSILNNKFLLSYFLSSPKKLFSAILINVSLYGLAGDIAELDLVGAAITAVIATAFAGAGAAVLATYFRKEVPRDPRELQ